MLGQKGDAGIEFTVGVAIFLIAFWFIFLQTTAMLTVHGTRSDMRLPAAVFLSSRIVEETGAPPDWTAMSDVTEFGLAAYESGKVMPNIIDAAKLTAMDGQDCPRPAAVAGLDFSVRVTSTAGNYSCAQSPPAEAPSVRRAVYVYDQSSGIYTPGTVDVYVW